MCGNDDRHECWIKFNITEQSAAAMKKSCEGRDVNNMSLFLSITKSGEGERANLLAVNTNGVVA